MKNIFRIFAFTALIGIVFTSCQKDNLSEKETTLNEEVQKSGESNKAAIIDGQIYQFKKESSKNTQKGLIADGNGLVETATALTMNSTEQYQTIKVYRQPYNPNNFFYIMIENLRYDANNNGTWEYNNDISNVAEYGRLYDWQTAQNSRLQVYMDLPKTVNGRTRIMKKFGELPSIQDVKDLLETTQNVGLLPSTGTDLNGGNMAFDLYYDVFVAGMDLTNNYADAYHSLAGWRDNLDVVPSNTEFNNINQKGQFWLSDSPVSGYHYPLSITYTDTPVTYLMNAFINAGHADRYGFSVRYVFYPFN